MCIELVKEQLDAVDIATTKNIMVLTGGPGTGKTTVCKEIIDRLVRNGQRVVCAAPTGKAAKRLTKQTERPAYTIHRLLAWSYATRWFTVDRNNRLEEDVVLIDEASMLDIVLTYSILDALKPGAKLILVGDVDQLPSISAGNVLRDIISSGVVPVVRLRQIHRQLPNSWICKNAKSINNGEMIHIDNENSDDFFYLEENDSRKASDLVIDLMTKTIPKKHGLDPFHDIQVLCPQKTGLVGVHEINKKLQAVLNPSRPNEKEWNIGNDSVFRVRDRVIHTVNNYNLGVFNGEVGTVIDIEGQILRVEYPGFIICYDRLSSGQLKLCYASTVHKFQGSECPCVVALTHSSHYYMLSRSLLYTAVTRAKQFVYLVGDEKGLKRAIKNNKTDLRYTSLRERLTLSEKSWVTGQTYEMPEFLQ